MYKFLVTVRLNKTERISYSAIGAHSCDLIGDACALFGFCGVVVKAY